LDNLANGFAYKVDQPLVSSKSAGEKYLIWHVQGGLGKNIAATALTKDIKKKHSDRKFIVVCSWPEVFLNNPHIDRVYQLGRTQHFYKDYIENKDVIVFRHEPYHQSGHITRKNHIIKSWCELLDIEYTNQLPLIQPNAVQLMKCGTWTRNKPLLVLQTCGGVMSSTALSYAWARDIPQEIAESIITHFSQAYHIMHVTRRNGYTLHNVERIDYEMKNMDLFSLLAASSRRILIDSSLQHAAASMDMPSTVLWVGTSPINFGYTMHNNIMAKSPTIQNHLINSYLFDYQFENNEYECPYNNVSDMFDLSTILT